MPRVVLEFNAVVQAGALQGRLAGGPQRGGSDVFASLLLEAAPAAIPALLEAEPAAIPAIEPPPEKRAGETEWQAGSAPAEAGPIDADPAAPPAAPPAPPPAAPAIVSGDVVLAAAPSPNPTMHAIPAAVAGTPVAASPAAKATAPDTPIPTAINPAVPENRPIAEPTPPKPTAAPAPGTTTAPVPDKVDSLPTDGWQQPAPVAGGKTVGQPVPLRPHAGRARLTPPSAGPVGIAGPATKPVDGETGKAPVPGEADAGTEHRVQTGERHAPVETKQASPHRELRFPPTEPAGPAARGPEIRITPALELAPAPIPSAPPSPSGATAASPPALSAPPSPPVPIAGLAVAIAVNAQSGRNRFEIRLDPPELGRIDVHLHVHADGHVTSHLVVDRSETLDLLRRDAADLERSLQQAGLKTADNGLQFSLRDRPQSFDAESRPPAQVVVTDPEAVIGPVMRGYLHAGQGAGLDIHV